MMMTVAELRHKAYMSVDTRWIDRYLLVSSIVGEDHIDWDARIDVREHLYEGMTEEEWFRRQLKPASLAKPESPGLHAEGIDEPVAEKQETWRDRPAML